MLQVNTFAYVLACADSQVLLMLYMYVLLQLLPVELSRQQSRAASGYRGSRHDA